MANPYEKFSSVLDFQFPDDTTIAFPEIDATNRISCKNLEGWDRIEKGIAKPKRAMENEIRFSKVRQAKAQLKKERSKCDTQDTIQP